VAAGKARRVIRKLERSHLVEDFDCGYEDLNRCISRFALNNQSAGSAQLYVAAAATYLPDFLAAAPEASPRSMNAFRA
jgi:hypothetical protein